MLRSRTDKSGRKYYLDDCIRTRNQKPNIMKVSVSFDGDFFAITQSDCPIQGTTITLSIVTKVVQFRFYFIRKSLNFIQGQLVVSISIFTCYCGSSYSNIPLMKSSI